MHYLLSLIQVHRIDLLITYVSHALELHLPGSFCGILTKSKRYCNIYTCLYMDDSEKDNLLNKNAKRAEVNKKYPNK